MASHGLLVLSIAWGLVAWSPAPVGAIGLRGGRMDFSRAGVARGGSMYYTRSYGVPSQAAAVRREPGLPDRTPAAAPRYRYRVPAAAGPLAPADRYARPYDFAAAQPALRYRRASYLSRSAWEALPCERRTVAVAGHTYYRCGAGWYDRAYYSGDVVYAEIWPPNGHTVEALPQGTETISAGDTTYYVSDDAFYKKDDGGFRVVDPPYGTELDALPKGARGSIPIVAGGETYFSYHGVFYREVDGDQGNRYVISPNPYRS